MPDAYTQKCLQDAEGTLRSRGIAPMHLRLRKTPAKILERIRAERPELRTPEIWGKPHNPIPWSTWILSLSSRDLRGLLALLVEGKARIRRCPDGRHFLEPTDEGDI